MSTWQDKLDNSKILPLVKSVKDTIAKVSVEKTNADERAILTRLSEVSDLVESIIVNSDAALINFDNLTAVENSYANLGSYLSSWISGNGDNYLVAYVIPETDTVLRNIPLISPAMNEAVTKDAITNLRRSAGQQKRVVDEIVEKIKAKGTLADETIDAKVAAASTKLTEVNDEVEEINESLATSQKAINQLANDQTAAFNTAENERTKAFTEQISSHQKTLGTSVKQIEQEAHDELAEVLNRTEASEAGALAAKEKAEKLLNIVSQDALVTDYSKNANGEKKSALIWQIVTAISILSAIVYAALLAGHANGTTSWQQIASKAAVVLASGALATYAGRQSAEHRTAQRNAEHMALQLSAVQPYLEGIEDRASREALLIKLADKLFGERKLPEKTSRKDSKKDDVISANQLVGLIQQFLSKR